MKHWKDSLEHLLASHMLDAGSAPARPRAINSGQSNRLHVTANLATDGPEPHIRSAQRIAQSYGHVLASSAPLPGCVADASQLPYEKDTIKQALAICLCASSDPQLIRQLKHGYLQLTAWQNGVGDKTLGLNFTRIDLEADPNEIAALLEEHSAAMAPWYTLIKDEHVTLEAELRALGFQEH